MPSESIAVAVATQPKTMARLLIAMFLVMSATSPLIAASPDEIKTANGVLKILPINHATMALAHKNNLALIDPVGSISQYEGLPTPTVILITDTHGDHASPKTALELAGPKTVIIAPQAVADKFPEDQQQRVTVLANDESLDFRDGSILAVPMYNITKERLNFHAKGRGNGYIITVDSMRVYISGDTEDIPEMRALKDIDVAFVCMNLPYTMTMERAADATLAFAPKIVYPYHYRNKDKTYSDTKGFKKIVSKNPAIEVRLRDWYAE